MDVDFLLRLFNSFGVSGNEVEAIRLCKSYMPNNCHMHIDALGNLLVTIPGNGESQKANSPHILVDAHIDEIGLQVTYIDNDGYIFVRTCGSVDIVSMIGSFVEIRCSGGETIKGVIGRKPVHLMKGDEKDKVPDIDGVWIDTVLDIKEVKEKVYIGDYITVTSNATVLGRGRIASKAIDNRIGAFVLTQLAHALCGKTDKHVTLAFTTQEELGCKGAIVSAYGKNFDYVVCIDAAFSSDVPDVSPRLVGDIRLGGGPVIYRNGDTSPELFECITGVARRHDIKVQISANYAASGGTNTRNFQLSGTGQKTATIGYAVRYMHTPVGMADLNDIENMIKLLCHIINKNGL